jgi:2-amino-4-hydroxy-6-hydroxymethyldihydropteridine diphosphokinase
MILIGLGGNMDDPHGLPPRQTLSAALVALATEGAAVLARSGWYRSEPVPRSDQPWFVNAVAELDTALDASALLTLMQAVETRFGRRRGARNAARTLDLDLLDYHGQILRTPRLTLPHPRLHERRFVLLPLSELAPHWRHPVLGLRAEELLARLGDAQRVERVEAG